MKNTILLFCILQIGLTLHAQQNTRAIIYDASSKEPLSGASVTIQGKTILSAADGSFSLPPEGTDMIISFSGYTPVKIRAGNNPSQIALQKTENLLQEIVVSANRDLSLRTQSPLSINTLGSKAINETKATTIDQLVNKSSGVYMINLGNEQHAMGIRQPMGTRSLFLYLEDGIPVRTSGVFNHNALMEINMAAVKSIEIIKGPGSSLYGGEAIGGVVNMITHAPPAIPLLKTSLQLNNIGYKRADLQTGFSKNKWGFGINGYYATRKSGFIEFTDFRKSIVTARADYRFNEKTKLENSFTMMDYYSDMTGSVDSSMFANKSFNSLQTFTYRRARTIRHRTTLIREWNDLSKTSIHAVFRYNSLGQNPSYRIRDDYRRQGNQFVGKKNLAHGEINENRFRSLVLIAQHRQKMNWMQSVLVGGFSVDASPNTAWANYIRINKDSITKKYTGYINRPDSLLVDYTTHILNLASYVNFECSPARNLRLVGSLRYDAFTYRFNNHLPVSAVSGSPDTTSSFSQVSPKIGFTYNFKKNRGFYFNYSRGFVPPQVSELFRSVKVPNLDPSTFDNLEWGAWAQLIKDKLVAEIAVYRLQGKNSIISVKFDDGTFGNANAGGTLHKGIEMGITATPFKGLQIRFNGALNKHEFLDYTEKGISYNGKEISNAPHWIHNAEISYRPLFLKGLRASVEWQKMSRYYTDPLNLYSYKGFDILNTRFGYMTGVMEIWLNVINLLDAYYAVNSSRSNFGTSYSMGEPRNFTLGISYDLGKIIRSKSN